MTAALPTTHSDTRSGGRSRKGTRAVKGIPRQLIEGPRHQPPFGDEQRDMSNMSPRRKRKGIANSGRAVESSESLLPRVRRGPASVPHFLRLSLTLTLTLTCPLFQSCFTTLFGKPAQLWHPLQLKPVWTATGSRQPNLLIRLCVCLCPQTHIRETGTPLISTQ